MVPTLATEGTTLMTKLSDTQSIILSAAAQRADGNVLPLPGSLRGGAATKVVGALLARGLIREHVVDSPRKADAAMNTIWRNLPEPDGRGVLLFITAAGADAIGIEPEAVPYAFNEGTNSAGEPAAGLPSAAEATPAGASRKRGRPKATEPAEAPKKRGRPKKAAAEPAAPAPRKARDDTKQAQLIAMLRRKEGATIAQIVGATGWQPHTVRGAFAGALKKKLGLTVTSEKVEGGQRVYRLPAEG
jgi:hypothetical protein